MLSTVSLYNKKRGGIMKENNIISQDVLNALADEKRDNSSVESIPVIKIEKNEMYAKLEDGDVAVKLAAEDAVWNRKNVKNRVKNQDVKSLYAIDIDSKEKLCGDEIVKLSYKMLGSTLTKCFTYPFGVEYFFSYDKQSGFFSRNMNEKFEVIDDMSRENLTQKDFYKELLRRLKARLIMGYLSVDREKMPKMREKDYGEYLLRAAKKRSVMKNWMMNVSEVLPYVNALEEKSYIPEEYYDSILHELCKAVYSEEMRTEDLIKLNEEARAELESKASQGLPVFTDLNFQKKIYNDMIRSRAKILFNMQKMKNDRIKNLKKLSKLNEKVR